MENRKLETDLPFVSIVMPIRNELDYIKRTLNAVLNQTYPKHLLEIIIADGMSTDGTRELIRELGSSSESKITVIDNHKFIMPTGLNLAIEASAGEIIILIGGHCEIDNNYVKNCVKHLELSNADVVGGPINTIGSTLEAQTIAEAMSSRFGVGGSPFRTIEDKELFVDTVAFGAYKKEILQKAGIFDEELVRDQDDEYNYRIRKLGGRILLAPDIRSKYYSRGTLRKLWSQYYEYGFYKVRVLQLHPFQMRLRQFIPLLFVLAILTSLALAIFNSTGAIILGVILTSYLVGNLLASLKVAYQAGIKLFPLLPLCFFILHFSYGLGFLFGLIYFINRWGEKQTLRYFQLKSS